MLCMENGPSLKLARVRHGENSRLCIKFCSYAQQLGGHAIKWFTDNQNVVGIVQVGVGSHISRMEL